MCRLSVLAVLIAAVGCSKERESGPKITGRVLVNGQPCHPHSLFDFDLKFLTVEGVGPGKRSYLAEFKDDGTFVLNGSIGKGIPTGRYKVIFNGAVDEVRFYERALNASEVHEDALSPVQAAIIPHAQPDDAYSFEEGYGHSTTRDVFGSADASLTDVDWNIGRGGGNALQFYPEQEGFLTVPEAAAPDLQGPFAIETSVEPQFPSETSPVLVERSPSGDELAINVVPDTERGFGWWTAEATLSGEGPTAVVSATSSYFSYEWEQVAVSSDDEHLSLYLNGELEDTASIEDMAAGKGPLYGGGDPVSGRYPQESIDDLRLYHHAIDQAQV